MQDGGFRVRISYLKISAHVPRGGISLLINLADAFKEIKNEGADETPVSRGVVAPSDGAGTGTNSLIDFVKVYLKAGVLIK